MKRLLCRISLIVWVFILSLNGFSQINDLIGLPLDCYINDDTSDSLIRDDLYDSRNGSWLSPHDTIRMLVVFAELVYTDTIPDPSLDWVNHYWDAHQLPIWADSLFAAYDTTDFSYKRVTKYFQYASSNDHIVLGDYLMAPTNNGVFSISTQNGIINATEIATAVNNQLQSGFVTKHGLSSFNEFDTWTPNNKGLPKIKNGNNEWDYVVFLIRNSVFPNNPNGYMTGGESVSLLNHNIDYYCMICAGDSKNPTHVIRHEYAHSLLGGNNFHTCGGGRSDSYNYWIPQTGGWALLGLYGSSLMCWNAWDRYRLGWKAIGNTYDISARSSDGVTEVNGDIDISNGNGTYILRDFVTTGDAIRIKLPFIDEDREYPEWIWLENHQGVNNNNIEFDQWQFQDVTCVQDFEPGLMAYIQINSDLRESQNVHDVFDQYANYLIPLTANGLWDRDFLIDTIKNNCVSYAWVRPFIRVGENPLTGCGDQSFYSVDLDGNDSLYLDFDKKKYDQLNNWTEITNNDTLRHLFQLGHSSHSFNMDGKKKIGVGTNPSSAPLINMVGQKTQYIEAHNLRTTYLNGISIEILEQYSNGNIKVRIRFDDVDIDNDVRWCSDNIVLNEIATSSGYSLNLKNGKTLTLDRGLTATRMTKPKFFSGKKVFTSPTTLTIQPDVKIHIDTAATIKLENKSKLHFSDRSTCVIEDNGSIEVKNGTVLQMDDCTSIIIKGNGKLIARSGDTLKISPTASLVFQNGLQNLIMEQGVIIPTGYANPNDLISTGVINNDTVSSNTSWNGVNLIVNGNIVVDTNAVLNITSSMLKFADIDSRIIVKRGGKLIIDNSTLTDMCGNMWQGVEVWGDGVTHQQPVHGNYLQGYLELKNSATIENAVCAVKLWNPNNNGTGGIIRATDAVFRNNTKAVHAKNFTNYYPTTGGEAPYHGIFTNCEFVIDSDYYGYDMFYKHVDMDRVNGIKFRGCDFSVSPSAYNVSSSCIGLGAYSSGFQVDSYCENNINPCPTNSINHCTFTGFNNGIFAINEGVNAKSFIVREAIFTGNNCGIFAINTGFATIVKNEFNISTGTDCGYGIYAEEVIGFCIEENSFQPVTSFSWGESYTYGIGIFNSHGANDIYKNTFDGLTCGNLSYGVNNVPNGGFSSELLQGLTYTCNENTNNDIDFCVLKDHLTGNIQSNQGSLSLPAGNTFSGSQYHFYNDGNDRVYYHYNSYASGEIPTSSKIYRVELTGTTCSNSCISHYGGGSVIKSSKEKATLTETYEFADKEYKSLKKLYDSQVVSGIKPDIELTAQLSEFAHIRDMAAGDIIRSNLNDSVENPTELRQWLGNINNIIADRMIVASYIHEGDFTNAFALANMLPNIYNLQGEDLAGHGDYITIINLYQSLYNSSRTIYNMTADEVGVIENIAKNGYGVSKIMAKGILMELDNRYTEDYQCIDMPNAKGRDTSINTDYYDEDNDDFIINIKPNPATTWVSVEYKLPEKSSKATATIINTFGMKVIEVNLEGSHGTKTIDLSSLPMGVYIVKIRMADGKEFSERIVKE